MPGRGAAVKKRKKLMLALRVLPLVLMLTLLGLLLFSSADFSAGSIVALMPKNQVGAVAVLLLLFVLKSLAIAFPIAALWIVSGLMFPLPAAMAVSLAGTVVGLSIPFFIGKFSGSGAVDTLMARYPKVNSMMKLYRGREFFFSYIVRYLPLPMDIASMLAGALEIGYGKFLLGGLLGLLPQVVAHTVLGTAITEPGSPAFWGSIGAMLLIGAVSLFFYVRQVRREK